MVTIFAHSLCIEGLIYVRACGYNFPAFWYDLTISATLRLIASTSSHSQAQSFLRSFIWLLLLNFIRLINIVSVLLTLWLTRCHRYVTTWNTSKVRLLILEFISISWTRLWWCNHFFSFLSKWVWLAILTRYFLKATFWARWCRSTIKFILVEAVIFQVESSRVIAEPISHQFITATWD